MSQILCPAKNPPSPGWAALPPEIKLSIIQTLLLQEGSSGVYAAVCQQWRDYIEERNFCRLKIRAACLEELQRMVVRQRELVKHVWIQIEIGPYTCRICPYEESFSAYRENNLIIRRALFRAFKILSKWPSSLELTLELSVICPSDARHWFHTCYFGADNEYLEDLETPVARQQAQLTDGRHGLLRGQQVIAPPPGAMSRLFGLSFPEKMKITGRYTLDEVRAVTNCPRLKSIVFETWRAWRTTVQKEKFDHPYSMALGETLPRELNSISVFEDFRDDWMSVFTQRFIPSSDVQVVRVAAPNLAATFAAISLRFQHISIAFMIDARYFFAPCRIPGIWNQLKSLALTSALLDNGPAAHGAVAKLLVNAGKRAVHMPSLQIMTIWNGTSAVASAFVYRRNGPVFMIAWRGTWILELKPCVLRVWDEVVTTACPQEALTTASPEYSFLLKYEEMKWIIIKSHGDSIYHLKLPGQVIDPVSLWQIRSEHS
ncbi:hypothetical protein NM208_g5457 [Fusarium decemcellulare]|uniref:Uncharacterized protein n=1 Tax=Fusarium decemcellulare TaxID=57161 RepID=A0ACC1SH86_9HYPO|nr:hypothetical protein NM208_g5457 [Fusarium decemcellulare]